MAWLLPLQHAATHAEAVGGESVLLGVSTRLPVCQVTQLLREYLATYELMPVFTEEEVLHYLMPVEGVIETHVVESKGKSLSLEHSRPLCERAWSPKCRPGFCPCWLSPSQWYMP